jgi:hypothetical protein
MPPETLVGDISFCSVPGSKIFSPKGKKIPAADLAGRRPGSAFFRH